MLSKGRHAQSPTGGFVHVVVAPGSTNSPLKGSSALYAHRAKPVTIWSVRDLYSRSSAKLLVASGVVTFIGVLVPWVRFVETVRFLDQTVLPKEQVYFGVSMAEVTNLAVWISALSIFPLAVGLIRQFVWKSMPDYIYRIIIPLAVADLVLLFFAWRHITSYELGGRTVLHSESYKGYWHAEIGSGLWLVVGAQIAVLVAGAKTDLFYEKKPFGWIHNRQLTRINRRSATRVDS
jgi:hypothetical protein